MNGYFSFPAEIEISSNKENVIVLFRGPGNSSDLDLSSAIQNELRTSLLPDHVVILVPSTDIQTLVLQSQKRSSPLHTAVQRGANSIESVVVAGYDITGEISRAQTLRGSDRVTKEVINQNLPAISSKGLSLIIERTDTLSRAPSGFVFSKPSSRKSNYFIRAENMLSETEFVFFLAYRLLAIIYRWKCETKKNLDNIYIDSMGISSLAFALSTMLRELNDGLAFPKIESFHSYEGLHARMPIHQHSFCIISASSSNGLAQSWAAYTKCKPLEVVTLISFSDASDDFPVLIRVDQPTDYESFDEMDNAHGRAEVRIFGERFFFKPAKPKEVELVTAHAPKKLEEVLTPLIGKEILKCRTNDKAQRKIRPLFCDGQKLVRVSEFKDWFSRCLNEIIPLSTRTIVYQNDEASRSLLLMAKTYFSEQGISDIAEISDDELAEIKTDIAGSVLILSAVAGNGSSLLSISQNLRRPHKYGTRVYVVGALLGKSKSHNTSLRANLTQPAKSARRHFFESYIEACIGAANDSWSDELSLINKVISQVENKYLSDRQLTLNATGHGLAANAFNLSSENNKNLALRHGFAFCSEKFPCSVATSGELYFAISWILQNARDSESSVSNSLLSSSELQQVVISPKCLTRFDDGIIQSAIIRSALPAELDYRDAPELSELMAKVIHRIVSSHAKARGEASTEICIALALGKIRLTPSVLENLKSDLLEIKKLPEHIKLIVESI